MMKKEGFLNYHGSLSQKVLLHGDTAVLILDVTDSGRVIYANDPALKFFGYDRKLLYSTNISDLLEEPAETSQNHIRIENYRTSFRSPRTAMVRSRELQFDIFQLEYRVIYELPDGYLNCDVTVSCIEEKECIWAADRITGDILYADPNYSNRLGTSPEAVVQSIVSHVSEENSQAEGNPGFPVQVSRLQITAVPLPGNNGERDVCIYIATSAGFGLKGQAEQIIEQQQIFQNMIAEISTEFLSADLKTVNTMIYRMLERTASVLTAQRSYVFLFSADGKFLTNHVQWCMPGVKHHFSNVKRFPIEFIPWVCSEIRNNRIVRFTSIEELKNYAPLEYDEFSRLVCCSSICIPIANRGNVVGLLGYDTVDHYCCWNEEHSKFLKILSNMLYEVLKKISSAKSLIKAKKQADRANSAKTRFIANLSHEIRSPLNSILGFIELLNKSGLNDVQRRYTRIISNSSHQMLDVIHDILDYSKIESGKMEIEALDTDIVEIIEQSADMFSYQAAKKGIELVVNITPDIPKTVKVDPLRLKQVLTNLIGNSIKFTNSGEVEIQVISRRVDKDCAVLEFIVRDTGIGISEEDQKKLFNDFSQANCSTTRKFGGTGLGLSISQYLVRRMGGSITVKSSEHTGSIFSFTLKTSCSLEHAVSYRRHSMGYAVILCTNTRNGEVMTSMLNHFNISSRIFASFDEVPEGQRYDFIICDYSLVGSKGLEIYRKARLRMYFDKCIMMVHPTEELEARKLCTGRDVIILPRPVKFRELIKCCIQDISVKQEEWSVENQYLCSNIRARTESPVILIAEDVVINMMVITKQIQMIFPHAAVLEAYTGKEVFTFLETRKIDLLMLDIHLPDMNGYQIAERIRERGISVPIIALTAGAVQSYREKCRISGMNALLIKPVTSKKLEEVISKNLEISSH